MTALAPAPRPALSPWQLFYGALLARRARRLDARAERLPVPVISVGNLAWGGAGKTPFTLALARRFVDRGLRVVVLSRGYGRSTSGTLVVCRGDGPEVSVDAAGDEPFEMARALPELPLVVGERRIDAARRALAEISPSLQLFLLDDAFSHRALARDLDLLLFPLADPWAGGRLLPSGRLREPLAAAARASAAVLTGLAAEDPDAGPRLGAELARFGFRGESFASVTTIDSPRLESGLPLEAGAAVFAVAAIARPDSFFAAAEAAGLRLVGTRALRDHAGYPDGELAAIEAEATRAGARALLTTAKDRAKIEGRIGLDLAVLPVAARPEERFWSWLDARLAALGLGQRSESAPR